MNKTKHEHTHNNIQHHHNYQHKNYSYTKNKMTPNSKTIKHNNKKLPLTKSMIHSIISHNKKTVKSSTLKSNNTTNTILPTQTLLQSPIQKSSHMTALLQLQQPPSQK